MTGTTIVAASADASPRCRLNAAPVSVMAAGAARSAAPLQRLLVVEARIDAGLVRALEVGLREAARAADALGDVLAGELEVHAAEARAELGVELEACSSSATILSNRRVLMPCGVVSVLPCIGSQTHSTVRPVARTASTSGGSLSATLSAPMRWISVMPAGLALGIEHVEQARSQSGVIARADLDAERVADAAEELDVRAVELRGAHADPREVRRQVVPAGAARHAAGLRLLVRQRERLVAREDSRRGGAPRSRRR